MSINLIIKIVISLEMLDVSKCAEQIGTISTFMICDYCIGHQLSNKNTLFCISNLDYFHFSICFNVIYIWKEHFKIIAKLDW